MFKTKLVLRKNMKKKAIELMRESVELKLRHKPKIDINSQRIMNDIKKRKDIEDNIYIKLYNDYNYVNEKKETIEGIKIDEVEPLKVDNNAISQEIKIEGSGENKIEPQIDVIQVENKEKKKEDQNAPDKIIEEEIKEKEKINENEIPKEDKIEPKEEDKSKQNETEPIKINEENIIIKQDNINIDSNLNENKPIEENNQIEQIKKDGVENEKPLEIETNKEEVKLIKIQIRKKYYIYFFY